MADSVKGLECVAVGRLSKDAEMRYLSNGDELLQFGFFVQCEVMNPSPELPDALTQGAYVRIGGRLNMRKWTDKNTGEEKTFFTVAGRDIQLLNKDGKPISYAEASSNPEEVPF